MKYFTNQSLTDEISSDTLDLGIVDAGESKKYSIWALNDYGTLIKDLKFIIVKSEPVKDEKTDKLIFIEHPEIKLVKAPKIMSIDDRKEIVFTWSPSITLKEGLKVTLKMNGKELWG